MTANFNTMLVPQLREYLRNRGISVTGYNKLQLTRLAEVASEIGLPTDVDLQECVTISEKVKALGLDFTDPFSVSGYSNDLTAIPCVSIYDIFNFLIARRSDYDRRKIKAYKSYEDYRLFNDGHVETVTFNPLTNQQKYCMFKCSVKPTQKDKSYLNKPYYDLWVIMEKTGEIVLAYCQCPGGADGACRHISAALFEIEAFEPQSCTDGENKWQKRPRHHDEPVPIQSLKILTAKYKMDAGVPDRERPYSDTYDPRQAAHKAGPSEESIKCFTQQLKQANPNTQALDILTEPMDIDQDDQTLPIVDHDPTRFSMKVKAQQFIKSRDGLMLSDTNVQHEFVNSLKFSKGDAEYIDKITKGQSENPNWVEMRKGMITASNFRRVVIHVKSGKSAPSLVDNLIHGNSTQNPSVPSLSWGRQKEDVAKYLYRKSLHKVHKKISIQETGLIVSNDHPFLACSPDGVVTCQCKNPQHSPRLLEVKCPYSSRTLGAKQAAVNKGCIDVNGSLQLMEDSEYYHQIQGQMGICGYDTCHLVIYTTKGIEVINVKFDPDFYKSMVCHLHDYFQTEMVPVLLSKS